MFNRLVKKNLKNFFFFKKKSDTLTHSILSTAGLTTFSALFHPRTVIAPVLGIGVELG